jgi:hypothetical protein
MKSKNKPAQTASERAHVARVKEMPCAVCGAQGPSDAHHVKQASAWHCVPLCKDCHQGSLLGIHGQRRAWALAKMDEVDALAATIKEMSRGMV